MNEINDKEKLTLNAFFDELQSDIGSFKRYMKEDTTENVSKKDIERFLDDILINVKHTIDDIEILRKDNLTDDN